MSVQRAKLLGLANTVLFYTFGFAVALFGSWTGTWLRPTTCFSWCVLSGLYFELMIHNAFSLSDATMTRFTNRSAFMEVGVILGYIAAPILAIWYNSPKSLLSKAGEPSWLHPVPMVLGILIYVVLMARAVLAYKKWASVSE